MKTKAKKYQPGQYQPGELHFNAKLSLADVRDIRARRKAGAKLQELADEYGVSLQCIWKIDTRTTWKNL